MNSTESSKDIVLDMTSAPMGLTAFKDGYKRPFPPNDSFEECLRAPSLDNIVEDISHEKTFYYSWV